jgi:DNA ligase 1
MLKPMLAKVYEDFTLSVSDFPVAVQPKLDGIRAVTQSDGLYTRNNKLIQGVPHISKAVSLISNIDGELYAHGKRFEDICGIVKRTTNVKHLDRSIVYCVFDYVADEPFIERFEYLKRIVKDIQKDEEYKDCIQLVETRIAYSTLEVDKHFQEFVQQGYEGAMIRSLRAGYEQKRTRQLLKRKPWQYLEAQVLSLQEGTGKYVGMLGAFECVTDNNVIFYAGSGLSDEQRVEFWQDKPKSVTARFQELTKYGVPRFPTIVGVEKW